MCQLHKFKKYNNLCRHYLKKTLKIGNEIIFEGIEKHNFRQKVLNFFIIKIILLEIVGNYFNLEILN